MVLASSLLVRLSLSDGALQSKLEADAKVWKELTNAQGSLWNTEQQLKSTNMGETAALLGEEKRRSTELEAARRSALMSAALARRPPEAGHGAGLAMYGLASRGLGGKAADEAKSDGTEVELHSSGSSI